MGVSTGVSPAASSGLVGVQGSSSAVTLSSTVGTFTTVAPANAGRKGGQYQNTGTGVHTGFIGSGTATAAACFKLQPGQTYNFNLFGIVEQNALQIASTVASDTGSLVLQ